MTITNLEYHANGDVSAITFLNVIETDTGPQVVENRMDVIVNKHVGLNDMFIISGDIQMLGPGAQNIANLRNRKGRKP